MRIAWLVVLAGCLEPSVVVCDNGTTCPVETVCLEGGGCAGQDDVSACGGRADGSSCTSAFGDGTCHAGVCRESRCGNGLVDPDEACDDGNTESGDGCNGTCRSDESCGNGIAELLEACDCGDADHPGGALCEGSINGGAICKTDCTLARCGDGTIDPLEVCDDGNIASGDGCNMTCTSKEVCGNGIVDFGEQCDDGNTIDKDDCQPNCQLPRCGDGFVDNGEACDDGNNSPGDGCSFACDSLEDCGNNIIDFFAGEECDDGANPLLHDGCTNTCNAERTMWEVAPPPPAPGGRHAHAVVYDSTRKTLVMFGGMTGTLLEDSFGSTIPLGDTWEWDPRGRHWIERPGPGPSPRFGHAMTYDSVRKRIVLFGGFGYTSGPMLQSLDDTWEWDSRTATWTQRAPATIPNARGLHSLAYDVARNRVVMFGGGTADTIGQAPCGHLPQPRLGETWEWNGTNWLARTPTTIPPARIAAGMAYDPTRQRVQLGAGLGSNNLASDTWEWTGTDWIGRGNSWAYFGYGFAVDVARNRYVAFGGEQYTSGCGRDTSIDSTFLANATTNAWSDPSPTIRPQPRSFSAAAFDPESNLVLVAGGQSFEPPQQQEFDDVWAWNGSAWSPHAPPPAPRVRDAAFAYDAARQQIVMFGGTRGLVPNEQSVAETWIWDGATWTLRTPAVSPPARSGAAMSYDPTRERVVLFGGGTAGNGSVYALPAETWEWDGTTWAKRTLSPQPDSRIYHAMTYDAALRQIVLFGGADSFYGASSGALGKNDTWTYDGNGWFQYSSSGAPPGRMQHALAYDTRRGRVVMFGGAMTSNYGENPDLADTWEWENGTWTLRTSSGPSGRHGHSLVEDPFVLGVTLFGGRSDGSLVQGTWRWDGAAGMWRSLQLGTSPATRERHLAAYDAARHRIVIAFGVNATTELTDTWVLHTSSSSVRDDDCSGTTDLDNDGLRGCADPDCWGWCTPACPFGTSCPNAPYCGDGVCSMPREDPVRCPHDCP